MKSPSCLKESEYYYPGCYKKYQDAFIECELDSDCVGVIKHLETVRAVSDDGSLNHAPEGYYVCRRNFTINQSFYDGERGLFTTKDERLPSQPKQIYKKKNGKGMLICL